MGAEEPVRLAVLGDIVLYDDAGAETPLAPQRLRILAALAAAAGSVVPRSALLDDVWGADTTTTRQRLKTQIAQIRSALGPGLAIEFRLDGYRLSGTLDQLDSTLFESLVTGARLLAPEAAAGRYEQALDLWRSPTAFAGIDSLLVDEARRSLEALRAATVVALARCEVELTRPRAALGPVRAAFDDDPTQGDVASLAATLLALGGRQIDALRLIERHRAALIEVGSIPGPIWWTWRAASCATTWPRRPPRWPGSEPPDRRPGRPRAVDHMVPRTGSRSRWWPSWPPGRWCCGAKPAWARRCWPARWPT